MKRLTQLLIVMGFLVPGSHDVLAQVAFEAQLSGHAGAVRALMHRAQTVNLADARSRIELQAELLQLQKQLHELEEEALTADLRLAQMGQPRARSLLLAAMVAKFLDAAQNSLTFYVGTQDDVFLKAAEAAAENARVLRAASR